MSESYTPEQVIALCEEAFDYPIAFHVAFARICDSATAGLMFSQMWYWTKKKGDGGWCFRSQADWRKDTCLSRREQETARRLLRSLGLIEEKLRGTPPKVNFRIKSDVLVDLLLKQNRSRRVQNIIEVHRQQLEEISQTNYARAVKLGCKAEQVSYADILVRDAGICYLCRKLITKGPGQSGDSLQFDHVLALELGGHHVSENIKATHATCNLQKGTGQCGGNEQIKLAETGKSICAERAPQSGGFGQTILETNQRLQESIVIPSARETEPQFALTPPGPKQVVMAEEPPPRFQALKHALDKCWDHSIPLQWGSRDDAAATEVLQELAEWNADQIAIAVFNRFNSVSINSSLPPHRWLKDLRKYGHGPLDRYDHDVLLSDQQREDHRAQARRILYGDPQQTSLPLAPIAVLREPQACTRHPDSGRDVWGGCWGCYSEKHSSAAEL
jgi:5-methylcytosine-specific restriction endonuclease McrA